MESQPPLNIVTILADHDIEGQASLLWGAVAATGWLEIMPMRLVRFADIKLARNSSDCDVWRFAQAHRMLLLTNNRNMEGEDSLEQTLREEVTATSLPVITVSDRDQMTERVYRENCAEKLIEIIVYLSDYIGVSRVYIP
jgi:hypothetical protein